MEDKPIILFKHFYNNTDSIISLHLAQEHDALRLSEIANDQEIAKNVGDTFPHPYRIEDAYKRINILSKKENTRQYGIYIDDQYAGNIGWQNLQEGRFAHNIHLGYWLGREYRGQGIMTAIVQHVISHIFFSIEDAHRVYARVFGRNNGSRKVLEKSGMKLESHRKEAIYYDGKRYDEYEYSILRNK